jgi:hypothetical protein
LRLNSQMPTSSFTSDFGSSVGFSFWRDMPRILQRRVSAADRCRRAPP